MSEIIKFKCIFHNVITSRKAFRKHIGEEHARNKFKSIELTEDNKNGVWTRDIFY